MFASNDQRADGMERLRYKVELAMIHVEAKVSESFVAWQPIEWEKLQDLPYHIPDPQVSVENQMKRDNILPRADDLS